MFEARAFVENIEPIKELLLQAGAVLKGEYRSKDVIYAPIDPNKSLADEFLRLRIHFKNIWNEKNFLVSIKQTKIKNLGKSSDIPLRQEFDSEKSAREFIEDNLLNRFKYDFEVTRTGWQYDFGKDQVDLEKIEDIDNCYSVEVKSNSESGIKNLLDMLNIKSVIRGPSVMEIRRLIS